MRKIQLLLVAINVCCAALGQETGASGNLPYQQIPDYPQTYSAGTVAARVVDGLGFRFYWATEGLRPQDLTYRPSEGARSLEETVDHIFGLVMIIRNTTEGLANSGASVEGLSFEDKRRRILENLLAASNTLKQEGITSENDKMVFQRGDKTQEYPFWNLLNGPIADAINHTGQVITFRRTAGNPINPKISVLTGSVLD